jgi:hypothetical protein
MKKFALLFAIALASLSVRSQASVTINLEVAQLLTSGSAAIPNGCLIELIGDTSTTFGAPTASSFTGTDPNEVVLDSFAMNSASVGIAGDFEQQIVLTLTGSGVPPDAGSDLLLRWFPTLTTSSSTPGAGTSYGQFTTTAVENGSNIAWVIPANGSTDALKFLTVSQGGSEANSTGVANLVVGGAVPEPSSLAAIGSIIVCGGAVALRRRRA